MLAPAVPVGHSAAWALQSPSLKAGAFLWSFQPPSFSQGVRHLLSVLSDYTNFWVFYCPLNIRLWGMEHAAGPFPESFPFETAYFPQGGSTQICGRKYLNYPHTSPSVALMPRIWMLNDRILRLSCYYSCQEIQKL